MKRSPALWNAAALLACLVARPAPGVIVFGSGDGNFNAVALNPPAGPLRNSGAQYQLDFHGFAATAIAPNFFLAAAHVGGAVDEVVTFRGVPYTIAAPPSPVPGTDFNVWRVSGTFPVWAPLYVGAGPLDPIIPSAPVNEIGGVLVAYGRGSLRGGEFVFNGTSRGWDWGGYDGVLRWGTNIVAATPYPAGLWAFVNADFNSALVPQLGPHLCHLSDHDSSGALFIQEAGVWKLAGIHYAVDGPFYRRARGGTGFINALHDARDLWYDVSGGDRAQVIGTSPVPTGFYSTRVSAYLPQILDLIGSSSAAITTFPRWQSACFTPEEAAANTEAAATADPEGDGLSNLAEYAFGSAPFAPSAEARPTASVATEGGQQYAAITYRRARSLSDVTYAVEASGDLQNWASAAGTTTLVSDAPDGDTNLVVVRDNTPLGPGAPQRFLRVRVTRP